MGASSQGGQMNPQGAQIRPQGQQQRPMGGQGKGPGLPMPQQPQMGGNRPYQPVGANNGPFNPNPVQPVNQPPQMPAQGKAPGQLPQGVTPQMLDAIKMQYMQQAQNGNPMGPGAPMKPQVMPMPPGGGYPMPPQRPFVGQGNDMPMQPSMNQGMPIYGGAGKGPM
jgi:hypothetical protein